MHSSLTYSLVIGFVFGREGGVENASIKGGYGTNLGVLASVPEVRISNQNWFGILEKVGLQD